MNVLFRDATSTDVAGVIDLLMDDSLGSARETADLDHYQRAFAQMNIEAGNQLIVAEQGGRIIATYQITFIQGLSLRAAKRAQLESLRVASDLRGQGIGHLLFADAEQRAKTAGCSLMQLTMNQSRTDTARFYESLGFTPSHIGYKRDLT